MLISFINEVNLGIQQTNSQEENISKLLLPNNFGSMFTPIIKHDIIKAHFAWSQIAGQNKKTIQEYEWMDKKNTQDKKKMVDGISNLIRRGHFEPIKIVAVAWMLLLLVPRGVRHRSRPFFEKEKRDTTIYKYVSCVLTIFFYQLL